MTQLSPETVAALDAVGQAPAPWIPRARGRMTEELTAAELAQRYHPGGETARILYDEWVAAGRPKAPPRPKPLRLRIEPEGAAGPHWLTLLALIGWLRGVVTWDLNGE